MTKAGSNTKAGAIADYEKLGAFYLGRRYDVGEGRITDEPVLYDARDLVTHAVCVGMTGSGKTGLGVALLEEAVIDGVPIIAIDPKGDIGNLLLTFPELHSADFQPWIDPGDAARKGRTVEEHARWTADLWRGGLADWGQDPSRIARFAESADRTIYTPASRSGRPVTILRSFAAPPPAVAADDEFRRERVLVTVSSLLALLGVSADPVRSREHILLSTILDTAWQEGRDLDIPALIREIQDPPVTRVGVMDLDTFYPQRDRFELAMMLNNLVAAPGFSAWMEGEPLDIDRLLYGPNGRPRISIFSIAHLSESERMFFVTVLLNEIVSWVRAQPGSRTLRALLYMDEIFGYFPPTAEPPSKRPMLTLLKQARAHGLGVVLCTQNPVDLDYKGLSNTGTWFIGRLQTERDKARVLDGLEGASATSGAAFDRGEMDRVLSGLDSRVFLMNNVHDDGPEIMHTRWVLSYLSGPMTREQIQRVQPPADPSSPGVAAPARPAAPAQAPVPEPSPRPVVPPDVREGFLNPPLGMTTVRYRPALLGRSTLHYARARSDIDEWRQTSILAPLDEDSVNSPWEDAQILEGGAPPVSGEPVSGASFDPLPSAATKAKRFARWSKMLKTHLYRSQPLELWQCRKPKLISRPGESEDVFRGRLHDLRREDRDLAMEKLKQRFAPKVKRLQERVARAEERVDREKEQLTHQRTQTAISVGATVLGALFGRKARSVGTVGRASSALRGASRSKREEADVARAGTRLEDLRQQLVDLEVDFRDRLDALRDALEESEPECTRVAIAPRKSDLAVDDLLLVWVPEPGAGGQ